MESDNNSTFFGRHEFLLRRLHSLSGLIPVGAYMVVHLLTNASILNGTATFQQQVYRIHSLGDILWVVEWAFIFIPILFHAIFGFVIIRSGTPNSGSYKYVSNVRYTLQRVTGMIAFLFIMLHVFHMHGWIHQDWWLNIAKSLNGAQFAPYNASSTAAKALQSVPITIGYVIGILSCVFHLANGMWTMGITWGIWTTPAAQKRADFICRGFGIGLALVGISALYGFWTVDPVAAAKEENEMLKEDARSKWILPNEHKQADHEEHKESESQDNDS